MRVSAVLLLVLISPAAFAEVGTQVCALPVGATKVVLGAERHVMPINGAARTFATKVSEDDGCSVECVRISAATMAKLIALVRAVSPLRHDGSAGSPHYGGRYLTVLWKGGACEFSDDSQGPVDERDRAKFDRAFGAIVAAAAARKP